MKKRVSSTFTTWKVVWKPGKRKKLPLKIIFVATFIFSFTDSAVFEQPSPGYLMAFTHLNSISENKLLNKALGLKNQIKIVVKILINS